LKSRYHQGEREKEDTCGKEDVSLFSLVALSSKIDIGQNQSKEYHEASIWEGD